MLQQSSDVDMVRVVSTGACCVPSRYNSQPWRSRWYGATLGLFIAAEKLPGDTVDRRYTDRAPLVASDVWAENEILEVARPVR